MKSKTACTTTMSLKQWNVGAVVLVTVLFTKWYLSRVLIAEKLYYFMTSLRGKNEVHVKFKNSMHNYNASLVH